MIRVLIVEDEPAIANALAILIRKSEAGFEVTGIAENGQEAIEYLKVQEIDALFTDVKMPIMDGFSLLEYLKKEKMEIPTVILSGYDEFDYARQAIRYQVIEYLLKPITIHTLKPVLEKLVMEHRKRGHKKAEQFLKNDRSIEKQEIMSGKCWIGAVCVGAYPAVPDDILHPANNRRTQETLEQIVEEEEEKGITIWLFNSGISAVKIVIAELSEGEQSNPFLLQYEKMRSRIELPITLITHRTGIDISSVGEMQARLCKELYSRIIFGKSKMFYVEQRWREPDGQRVERTVSDIIQGIKEAGRGLGKREIETFLNECEVDGVTQQKLFHYLTLLLAHQNESNQDKIEFLNIGRPRLNSNTYNELRVELEEIGCLPADNEGEMSSSLAEKLKEYLDQNFREHISNEHLASEFGFVSYYLGRVFKKQYGDTISSYIVKKRMEDAKALLRKKDGRLVKEIALSLGYSDPYYFSKVFHKETGYWPTDY